MTMPRRPYTLQTIRGHHYVVAADGEKFIRAMPRTANRRDGEWLLVDFHTCSPQEPAAERVTDNEAEALARMGETVAAGLAY